MRHRIIVYWDNAESVYRYEHWEHDKRTSAKHTEANEEGLLDLFSEIVAGVTRRHNLYQKFSKHRSVNMHHVPPGVRGIRTFDPAKVKTNRTLFDIYEAAARKEARSKRPP